VTTAPGITVSPASRPDRKIRHARAQGTIERGCVHELDLAALADPDALLRALDPTAADDADQAAGALLDPDQYAAPPGRAFCSGLSEPREDRTMNTLRSSSRVVRASLVLLVILAERIVSHALGVDTILPGQGAEAAPLIAWAIGHCDTLDGPVVTAARKALDTGNVRHALPWVREEDELEIRRAFENAMAVRGLNAPARALADRHFFETLVRVHRASEGEPYSGLKPAGTDLGPAVPAADQALEDGSPQSVIEQLTQAVRAGIERRFDEAMAHRHFAPDDVAAGRRAVETYVRYVHYVEQVWAVSAGEAEHGGHAAGHGHHG
jgi:hypothetical protein